MTTSNKIVCFGELLLHFAPDISGKWLDQQQLTLYIGGAEYNVAKALSVWGNSSKLVTALPDNFVGNQLHSKLKNDGIEVLAEKINGRMGAFYLSSDEDMQHTQVVYDRFPSVFTETDFSSFNFDEIFNETTWLHISTITPALSENAFQYCISLMKEAKKRNIKVSLDLNYRAALWGNKNPYEKVVQLLPFVNVLMGNLWSIQQFLNIKIEYDFTGFHNDENLLKQAELSAKKIQELFPDVEVIANTFRFTKGEEVNYFTTLFTEGKLLISEEHYSEKVEERIGSGDTFMAALIHGFLKNNEIQKILNDATEVAFQKLFLKGDTINETITIN